MNKKMKFLCALVMMLVVVPFIHVHDENCGYDQATDSGCAYEISPLQDLDTGI